MTNYIKPCGFVYVPRLLYGDDNLDLTENKRIKLKHLDLSMIPKDLHDCLESVMQGSKYFFLLTCPSGKCLKKSACLT